MVLLESKIFHIVVIVVAILFIILFAVNAHHWNRIRNDPNETSPVTRDEASVQFWLNVVWIIIALALIAYALFEIFYTRPTTAACPVVVRLQPQQQVCIPPPRVEEQACIIQRKVEEGPVCPLIRPGVPPNATPLYMLPQS